MDVLTANLRELIIDQRHFLARAEKILDFLEKNNIPTDTSFTSKTDPEPFNTEERYEFERAVREAALYFLNAVNKKSSYLENPESKAKNPSKLSSRVKSTKKEKNPDTDDSNSPQLSSSSSALSDTELPISNCPENRAGIAPQKKAVKKNGKAKNQSKQSTSDLTTSNSNTYAEDVFNGNNMDISLASYRRFNQFPCFESSSDNHGPNSIPPWFWYLYSLILLNNSNPSQVINFTDNSQNIYIDNSRKSSQRIKGKGNRSYNSMDIMRTKSLSDSIKIGEVTYEIQNGDLDLDLE